MAAQTGSGGPTADSDRALREKCLQLAITSFGCPPSPSPATEQLMQRVEVFVRYIRGDAN